ncbi:MAG: hypothetical protein C0582_01465 [Alphaproteobacteria bacterium]|nr:MAG: hypothetical protein C0582_01465 [Alphaproteobacteria bacterium]
MASEMPFSERAVKRMTINMVAQYVGGEVLNGLKIDPTPGLGNLSGLDLVNTQTVLEKSKYNGNPGTLSLSSSPKKGTSVSLRFSEQCFPP